MHICSCIRLRSKLRSDARQLFLHRTIEPYLSRRSRYQLKQESCKNIEKCTQRVRLVHRFYAFWKTLFVVTKAWFEIKERFRPNSEFEEKLSWLIKQQPHSWLSKWKQIKRKTRSALFWQTRTALWKAKYNNTVALEVAPQTLTRWQKVLQSILKWSPINF